VHTNKQMARLIRYSITTTFLITLSGSAFAGINDSCTYNAQSQMVTDMSGSPDSCNADPVARKLSAYKVGLCTELPYYDNYQKVCDFLFESTTPIDLIAEKGFSKSIEGLGDVTLVEGKAYSHSVILASNTTYVKGLMEFDSPRLGKTGSGTYCWSTGSVANWDRTSRSNFTAECGLLSEANPQYNTMTNYSFKHVSQNIAAMERNFPDYNGGWTNELMSSETEKATFDNGTPSFDDTTNAIYWLGGRPINPSVTVTSSTTNLDLKFLVSWGSIVRYSGTTDGGDWHADCASTPCIGAINIAGFDLNVELN